MCRPPVPVVRPSRRVHRCAVREQQRYDGQVPVLGGEVERRHAVAAHRRSAGWGPMARRASPAWPQANPSVHTHHLFVLRLHRRRAPAASWRTRLAHVRPRREGVSTYGEPAVHSHGTDSRKRAGDAPCWARVAWIEFGSVYPAESSPLTSTRPVSSRCTQPAVDGDAPGPMVAGRALASVRSPFLAATCKSPPSTTTRPATQTRAMGTRCTHETGPSSLTPRAA